MPERRRVVALGIDPGFSSLGYARVELLPSGERLLGAKVILTKPGDKKRKVFASDDNVRRGIELYRELVPVVEEASVLCAEAASFTRSASVAHKMGISWGVILTLAHTYGVAIVQVSPQVLKKAVCGDASGSKDAVQLALCDRYGREAVQKALLGVREAHYEHACDALGAVVACLSSPELLLLRRSLA